MSRKRKQKRSSPACGNSGYASVWMCAGSTYDSLCVSGYTRLADNPEVQMAVGHIARLVGSMTIYLMRNTKDGDVRVKNELSKKVDVNPYRLTTRQNWMQGIVKNMLIEGNQIVYPQTSGGYLEDLIPLSPSAVSIQNRLDGYTVQFNGREYDPDEVLHFIVNPSEDYPWYGLGYRTTLKDAVGNLKQASATKKGFMESKWKPSVIVKVDGLSDAFGSPEGRKKLLDEYIASSEAGEPWMIPAEQFSVEQVKPLSLNDLAINETVELDKRTVAAIFGVPAYVVGAGTYNKDEHRHFIDTTIMPIAKGIAQELTKKLLLSTDLYFKLAGRALYGYDMAELSNIGQNLYVRGIMTGNEVRDWLDLSPIDGLDERVILENYIPAGMIGEQKKLNPEGGQQE